MFTPTGTLRSGVLMTDNTGYNTYTQLLKGVTAFSSGTYNFIAGFEAGKAMTTCTGNIAIGYQTGTALIGGSENILLGFVAGNSITNGNNNQFIGSRAGQAVGSGTVYSTLIGTEAGRSRSFRI